ncbi:MAG: hypothetical protein JWP09_709 [Candidatus Taylorbacteria bacterium]|nr:hypothetical protein [Candidatus Taylorbacteria bacterium]
MKIKKKRQNLASGFTLLELLVVIAIIGILAAVVTAALLSSRAKSKIASAQTTMSSILPIAVACMDSKDALQNMASLTEGGGDICGVSTPSWPVIAPGWTYSNPISDPSSNTFSFSASDDAGNSVTCTDSSGCVTTSVE